MKHYLKLITAIGCLAMATPLLARAEEALPGDLQELLEVLRSDVNTYKIETLNRVMGLTAEEAETFWPIYQSYERELGDWNRSQIEVIRDFLELQAAGDTEGEAWQDLAKRFLRNKKAQVRLWDWYRKRISLALSPYRAAQFLQVEHQMSIFISLNVAAEMPMISLSGAGGPLSPALASDVPTREEWVHATAVAAVEAVDPERREVTLKGPLGGSVTVVAGEDVKRFDEINVGDMVSAEYYLSVAAELREPTEEEKADPLVILEGAGRAPEGAAPAGEGLRRIRAVCSIEGLDRSTESVTLKGPLGRYVTVGVADPANLPALRIGDSVVVTYTEALAVSLEKLP